MSSLILFHIDVAYEGYDGYQQGNNHKPPDQLDTQFNIT